jgi:hypothetical protein
MMQDETSAPPYHDIYVGEVLSEASGCWGLLAGDSPAREVQNL